MRTRNLVHLALLMCAFVTLPAMAWDMNCRFSAQREASIDTAGAERVTPLGGLCFLAGWVLVAIRLR